MVVIQLTAIPERTGMLGRDGILKILNTANSNALVSEKAPQNHCR